MSTRARVHTYTRFEIETSSPSNQIYARLVFRARRIWTEHASKQRASASHLSLVERGATFPFSQKNRNNSAGFFQPLILHVLPLPLFFNNFNSSPPPIVARNFLARACVNFH